MRPTPKLVLLAATAVALPLFATPAAAQHYDGGLTVNCKEVVMTNSGVEVLDRDNTGEGKEAFTVKAYDGNHVQILDFHFSNYLTTYPGGLGDFSFTSAPTANPITVYVVSDAGNGLDEETQYVGSGNCKDLRPPLTLDPSATTEPPVTEVPSTETTIVDETPTTVMPTPTTAAPTTVTPNGNVRPATGAKPRSGNARYTG